MASDKRHERTKVTVAHEVLGVTVQYLDDSRAYEKFCNKKYFIAQAKKPGRKLNISDIPNTVAQFACNAKIRRRKKVAYKIGRVVECCLREKIEPWGFPDFIAGHGSFTKAYNYAVKTYPRSVDTEEVAEIDPESATEGEGEDQNSDKPTSSGDDVFEQDSESDSPESDQHRAPKPRKPDWAKSEHSVNLQALTDCDFSTLMNVGPVEERWVLIGGRPFDGDYVDLCIREVAPEGAVVMLNPPAEG
ncbi:hypothetical protein [Methylobacterium sp. E-046]|uniref:hypothetical protein n=1 Tax=Methylobacterium sp. E-046 TaxID=2836576 RepID=UPI001FB8F495|nr:hypothetical protein [Methylobacterium sp. E-046]MCJ2099767.1 hypothetical protein [Methylobacterium sp. E-046]